VAKPYAKGEGAPQMVADMVLADYGWLQSPDGSEDTRVLFKVGKNHEGYFILEDILKQTEKAINILEKYYPDEDHVLVYDNTTTHLKQPDGALSA
jgi:predicted ABC-type ATPase